MLFDVATLVDLIATKESDALSRERNATAILLRDNALSEEERNHILKRQQLLTHASDFRQSHPQSTEIDKLYDWFIGQTQIDQHEKWAMHCWYEKLNRTIPAAAVSSEIAILGSGFIAEPPKFAAFVYWLCENNVSPEELVGSGVLHRYCHYHISVISELHKTYALLDNTSEKVDIFLAYVKNISCQLRGFYNRKVENGFCSHNLMGHIFFHDSEKATFHSQWKTLPSVQPFLLGHGTQFYRLFGWEFIGSLNLNFRDHKTLFLEILNDETIKHNLLGEFERRGLCDEIDIGLRESIFDLMSEISTQLLIGIIQQYPYVIHGADISKLPRELIDETITKFFNQKQYYMIAHVPLLVRLYQRGCNVIYIISREKILTMIMKIVRPYGNALSESIFFLLDEIRDPLKKLFDEELRIYQENMSRVIEKYLLEANGYDEILRVWSSQLSNINLIRQLYPKINIKPYLHNKYDLKTHLLMLHFNQSRAEKIPFLIGDYVEKMCEKSDIRKTLQEALIAGSPQLFLQSITGYVVMKDSPTEFFHTPFGFYKSIVDFAIKNEKIALIQEAFRFGKKDDFKWIHALSSAISQYKRDITTFIANLLHQHENDAKRIQLIIDEVIKRLYFNSSEPSEELTNSIIHFLRFCHLKKWLIPDSAVYSELFLLAVKNYHLALASFLLNKYPEYIEKKSLKDVVLHVLDQMNTNARYTKHKKLIIEICFLKSENKLTQSDIYFVFKKAIEFSDCEFVHDLCALRGSNQLSRQMIDAGARLAANSSHWDIVQFLCGLINNVKLYLDLIQNTSQFPMPIARHFPAARELLAIKNINGDNLLHLAARSRCYATVYNCLQLLMSTYSMDEFREMLNHKNQAGELPHCRGRFPSAIQINNLLATMTNQIGNIELPAENRKRKRAQSPTLQLKRENAYRVTFFSVTETQSSADELTNDVSSMSDTQSIESDLHSDDSTLDISENRFESVSFIA